MGKKTFYVTYSNGHQESISAYDITDAWAKGILEGIYLAAKYPLRSWSIHHIEPEAKNELYHSFELKFTHDK